MLMVVHPPQTKAQVAGHIGCLSVSNRTVNSELYRPPTPDIVLMDVKAKEEVHQTPTSMAHLPSGDMAERAKAHGITLQPVPADQRGRCYVLTAFNSTNAALIEPTFSSELLHLLVYQQELTSGIDNGGHQYPHLQIYCIFRSRHTASKALRLLWPMSKNQSVYIAMARKGSSHSQLLSYVQKPESRVPGTKPILHGRLGRGGDKEGEAQRQQPRSHHNHSPSTALRPSRLHKSSDPQVCERQAKLGLANLAAKT